MITPCPQEIPVSAAQENDPQTMFGKSQDAGGPQDVGSARPQATRTSSWRSETSHFDPVTSDGDDVDPTELWHTMLAIQRVFGCYNSARMRAALELGDDQVSVPSKLCLDLLNDSISQLPDEARQQLEDFLHSSSMKRMRRRSSSSFSSSRWRRRVLGR